jgi:hypothetical protein
MDRLSGTQPHLAGAGSARSCYQDRELIALEPVALGRDFVYCVTETLTQYGAGKLENAEQAQRRNGYVEKTALPYTISANRYAMKGITNCTRAGPT